MLTITNLHVRGGNREILRGINLSIDAGEVHAIMGPNGSGKSTLARVLAGHPEYEVTQGTVLYDGRDLLAMDPESRAREGVFMAFQYPVEIPGVNNAYFLKAALNALRKHRGLEELDAMEFMSLVRARITGIVASSSSRTSTNLSVLPRSAKTSKGGRCAIVARPASSDETGCCSTANCLR